jgi:hypothetical protein
MPSHYTATLTAEVVEFDSLKAKDQEAAFKISGHFFQAFIHHLDRHHGTRLALVMEATHMARFSSALDAVGCAVELQRDLSGRSKSDPAWHQARVRIDVHDDSQPSSAADYYNARQTTPGEPGGICVSHSVYDTVREQFDQHDGTKNYAKQTALLCQDIRQIWDETTPSGSLVIQVSIATLLGKADRVAIARDPVEGANDVVQKVLRFLGRMIPRA